MLYHPPGTRPDGLWDTWLLSSPDGHWLFSLWRDDPASSLWDSFRLAWSDDTVHWQDRGVVLRKPPGVDWMGTGHTWRCDGRWLTNFSECRDGLQRIRFASSYDLMYWDILPGESRPDPRWHQTETAGGTVRAPRWDCIYAMPAESGRGWIGFCTATANAGPPGLRGVAATLHSADGVHWHAGPMPAAGVRRRRWFEVAERAGSVPGRLPPTRRIVVWPSTPACSCRSAGPDFSSAVTPLAGT
jgi:hypothetical protein